MGCGAGKESAAPERGGASGARQPRKHAGPEAEGSGVGGKLLDKYTLGKQLGQGAFGVVYRCTRKGSREEFAVKMIDQVESPIFEIRQEVQMLQKLSHPCVIQLYDVYYEKVFVCMVLELYKGGDMIQGMMAHWKTKGMVPMGSVRALTKQMWESITWMHSKACVHRDVKGDNFMMDTPDVENPRNRLYLSDFGTVRELGAGERLTSKCGTKNYWSPEFHRMNYGLKVDCWAVGVVMFGLFTGKFPFKGEDDVLNKRLALPGRVGKEGEDLLQRVFERNEVKRYEAKQALVHTFCAAAKLSGPSRLAPEVLEPGFVPEVKETGANAGVAERRRELVDRLAGAKGGDAGAQRQMQLIQTGENSFAVRDNFAERALRYEWWPDSLAQEVYDSVVKAPKVKEVDSNTAVDTKSIVKMLKDHKISTDFFGRGKAKSLEEFVSEIQSGQSQLLLDATQHKHLVRVVDVVLLRLVIGSAANKKYLIELSEQYPDGRTRRDTNQMPGCKKAPHENARQTAERLCQDILDMADCKIRFELSGAETFEQAEESPSYPGVQTVYRKQIVAGTVRTIDREVLARIGMGASGPGAAAFEAQDPQKYTRGYAWLSEAECKGKGIRLRAPAERGDISALVHPPIGLEEDELNEYLNQNNIDVSKWGKDTFKSLAEFSEELMKGEATLAEQAGGKVMRVVDVVILRISKAGGDVLVEVEETHKDNRTPRKRLPAIKRRADEHQFLAARRLVTKFLQLDDNSVNINPADVRMVEEVHESASYYGLPTLYRKRFMFATLG